MNNWFIERIRAILNPALFGGRSSKWPAIRRKFVEEHPYCAVCGSTKRLECHHVLPFHEFPSLELQECNLIVLCRHHHFWFGHLGSWFSHNYRVKDDAEEWYIRIQSRP